MKSSEHWYFACYYGLLRTRRLCLFLSTDRNPTTLHTFMKSSEAWLFAYFFGLLRSLFLCLFLWTDWNPAYLAVSMDWFFTCFYEKLRTLILCLFLSTHMYWLDSQDPELFLCLEPWNPASLPDSMDCSEPSLYTYYYEKLGTLILCFLWTAPSYI